MHFLRQKVLRFITMGMKLAFVGLLLAAVATLGQAADCPSPEKVAPCRCDPNGVSCVGPDITYEQIRDAFQRLQDTWRDNQDRYVRRIWIQGTKMKEIKGDTIKEIRSARVYVQQNDITNVHNLDFLNRFKEILRILNLYGNQIENMNYGQLKSYKFLEEVNLGKNKLKTVDTHAFTDLKYLKVLILSDNQITTLNRFAFERNEALERLDISRNQITTLGPNSILCTSLKPNFHVSIADNPVSSIDKNAFEIEGSWYKIPLEPKIFNMTRSRVTSLPSETFIKMVSRMAQIRGTFDVTGVPLSCKGPDYCWIVHNKDSLADIFIGFECTDGKSLDELTLSNTGC